MALNITEAQDVSSLIEWTIGVHLGDIKVDSEKAGQAATRLACKVQKTLHAGVSPEQVRQHWPSSETSNDECRGDQDCPANQHIDGCLSGDRAPCPHWNLPPTGRVSSHKDLVAANKAGEPTASVRVCDRKACHEAAFAWVWSVTGLRGEFVAFRR